MSPGSENRRETRVSLSAPVTLDVLGANGFSTPAELFDLSPHGMRLAVTKIIPEEAAVRVNVDGDQYLGEVAHFGLEGGRFFIGVRLSQVIRDFHGLTRRMERMTVLR